MQRQRGGLVPIGEAFGGLDGPVKALRDVPSQEGHLDWSRPALIISHVFAQFCFLGKEEQWC